LHRRPSIGTPFRVVNGYGPTETTIFATSEVVAPTGSGRPPIGNPLPYSSVYLLDKRHQPVPAGAIGEIYLGGPGVARGYLGQPGLTAQRFLPDPFTQQIAARMYRTGDLGRQLPDRKIEFVGRIDDQVKIRGTRVEPDEVTAALAQHPALAAVRVEPQFNRTGEAQVLVAYVVPHDPSHPPAPSQLRRHLTERLPTSMLPSRFVTLIALPLNSNGKLDRTALPSPVFAHTDGDAEMASPMTGLERRVAEMWARTLDLPSVGLDDIFFDLGGHSVLLAQLHDSIEREFGEVPIETLFTHNTVRLLSGYLGQRFAAGGAPKPNHLYE
jgi:acyl-CoA synthetase (AMP-forming)/AMP-acid ligase II